MLNAKSYKTVNVVVGWAMFLFACTVFWLTAEPTLSFWDCGEFLSCADKLQIAHSPGSPLFLMIGRMFMMLTTDTSQKAVYFNHWSNIVSALAVMFLFWSITHLVKKMLIKKAEDYTTANLTAIIGAGLVGASAFTFCDSFWFSAVEAIVWASSSIFYSFVFWAVLKWENEANEPQGDRWLLVIAYMVGLSIGVHLLCLLVIPSVVMIYYFKKFTVTTFGAIKTLLLSFLILFSVQYIFIQGLPLAAAKWDIFFVNTLGLPFNIGVLFWILILLGAITYLLLATQHRANPKYILPVTISLILVLVMMFLISNLWVGLVVAFVLAAVAIYFLNQSKYRDLLSHYSVNMFALTFLLLMLGYSTYVEVVIRADANPPINMSNPNNAYDLVGYLDREQYGTQPFLYGPYYNTQLLNVADGDMQYHKGDKKYEPVGAKPVYKWDPDDQTLFPRIWDAGEGHAKFYQDWLGYGANDQPVFIDNLKFFFGYQCWYMYWRYFLWNFSGRQNDIQGNGNGDYRDGNWITGISVIDNAMLGPQNTLPPELKDNRANNKFYLIPFIVGILGLAFQYKKSKNDFWAVFLFWFLTGLGIIIFLNQTPDQPRERDYSYVASFYAFCIWIGIGSVAIYQFLSKKTNALTAAFGGIVLAAIAPILMGTQNWNDHDRSKRYTARDLGIDYLQSCAPNAILFTEGDNDTYPLWYCQEVENIRPDVRVINLSLLGTDWYVDELRKKANTSPPINISFAPEKYHGNKRDYVLYHDNGLVGKNQYVDIRKLMDFIGSDDQNNQVQLSTGEYTNFFPTKNVFLPVDKNQIIKDGIVAANDSNQIVSQVQWTINRSNLQKNDLMVLDIVASNAWARPIYFTVTTSQSTYLGMQDYLQQEGLCDRLVPIKRSLNDGLPGFVNTNLMYDNMMHKFKWGNVDKTKVNLDSWNIMPMWQNFRSMFGRLADVFVTDGKNDSAIQVLDYAQKVSPVMNVPLSWNMMSYVSTYYRAGAPEKGMAVAKEMLPYADGWLQYYTSLTEKTQSSFTRDAQYALYTIQTIAQTAQQFNDPALEKLVDPMMKKYGSLFQQMQGQ